MGLLIENELWGYIDLKVDRFYSLPPGGNFGIITIAPGGDSRLTIQQKIDMACVHAGISRAELARRLGTTPPAFKQRFDRGKFTQEELEKIASILDGEYFSGFKFSDGTIIE